MSIRLDQLIVKQGRAPSRTKAQDMIRAGEVVVAGETITDPSQKVAEDIEIEIRTGETLKYVSRAGLKLESALLRTKVLVRGLVCLDIGQSTGGFTDVLLKSGAKEVWGLDVGHGQLHPSLKAHPQVKYFENLDIRQAKSHPELKNQQYDLVVADLSFISLEKVLSEIYYFLKPAGHALLLVKPQFELEKKALNKQGLVKDQTRIQEIESKLRVQLAENHFHVCDFFASGVKGKDGNQEYFFYVRKN